MLMIDLIDVIYLAVGFAIGVIFAVGVIFAMEVIDSDEE